MGIKNLIFIFYPTRGTTKNQFFKKIAENIFLKNKDFNFIAITIGKQSREFLSRIDVNWDKTYDLIKYINKSNNYTINNFNNLVNKYELFGINETFEHGSILFSKRFPGHKYSDDEKNYLLYSILKFWESVLKDNNNSILLDEGVAGLFTPLYKLFPQFNSYVFNMTVSRTSNKFVITHEGYQQWDKLEKKYNMDNYSSVEIDKASKYIKQFIKSRTKPKWYYIENKKRSPKLKFSLLLYKITRMLRNFIIHLKYPSNIFVRTVKSLFSEKLDFYKSKFHYKLVNWEQIDNKKKYFIYPLHVYPEATINVVGTYYTNQLDLIKKISLALPIDVYLYVKEHSAFVGKRENIKFYDKIKKLKNVKLIDPFVDPHDIIKSSQGIITISSTMGFEGIMYKKPIILFGDAFYKSYKYSYRVKNINNLNNIMRQCLKINGSINNNEVEKFIAAYLHELYDGNLYFSKDKDALKKSNIHKIKDAIFKEINYIE